MKILSAAMAALLFAVTSASNASANLLLGKWTLDPAAKPSSYCLGPLEFTATSFTQRDIQGKLSTIPVTYIAGETKTFPTTVYMMMGVDHVTYVFSGNDKMVLDTWLQCAYVRA